MPGEIQSAHATNKPLPQLLKQEPVKSAEKYPISTIDGAFQEGDTSYQQCRIDINPKFAKGIFKDIDRCVERDHYLDGLEICKYRDIECEEAMWHNTLTYMFTFYMKGARQKYLDTKKQLRALQEETNNYRKAAAKQMEKEQEIITEKQKPKKVIP